MGKRLLGTVLVLLAGLAFARQAAQTPLATVEARQRVRTAVLQALLDDPELGQYPLAASVGPDLGVQLNGTLPNQEDKARAGKLAKAVEGVAKVDNAIRVDAGVQALTLPSARPPAQAAAQPAAPAEEAKPMTNAAVQAAIEGDLRQQPALQEVTVQVQDRAVLLAGQVHSAQAKAAAGEIAGKDAEGRKVVNQIGVSGTPGASPTR